MSTDTIYRTLSSSRLPMKDALRNIRFLFRRGRDLLDPPADWPPDPISRAVKGVLSTVDRVALNAEQVIINAEHSIFDEKVATEPGGRSIDRLRGLAAGDVLFAQVSFELLSNALRCLGAKYGLTSERRAAEAFSDADLAAAPQGDAAAEAARLFAAMRRRGVIRDAVGADRGVPSEAFEAIALFAALLWMFSELGETPDDDVTLLEDCCEIARALQDELLEADEAQDRLATLFAVYIDKV